MSYESYHLTIGNGTDSYTLVYELNQHRPAQEWARLMQSVSPDSLRKGFNPWVGLLQNRSYLSGRVDRLNELISLLNQWVPSKIETTFNEEDYQSCLNKLHIHFPELENTETDTERLSQLSEYNDTIHELEHLFRLKDSEKIMVVLCPEMIETVPLNDDDYNLFDPNVKFGEMVLHYPHVGRNCFELLKADDTNCPMDQFKPQSIISVYHHLRFFKDPTDTDTYRKLFRDFYYKSNIRHSMDINDPKLAFGFIKLGRLVSDLSEAEIKQVIKTYNKVISWKVT